MLKAWERLTSRFQRRRQAAVASCASEERETTLAPPPSPCQFQPGDVVGGRFRILRPLGKGGMGEVYEAEDELLHDLVALKTVHSESLVTRFEREALLAKKVTHPNVCRIHDIGVHQGTTLFLTMELLAGETLSARLQRGRMTTAEALPLVRQMAAALDAAHQAGVIHRDFKPANVMLVGDRAVVTDFGLARTVSIADATVTQSGTFVGTPDYMAPEQVLGKPVGPATDVYALGVVMYEMVTGARPFTGGTTLEAAFARLHSPPTPPRRHVKDLDPAWETVLLRCLEREPQRRFQSAGEVARALEERPRLLGRRFAAAVVLILVLALAGWFLRRSTNRPAAGVKYVALMPLRVAPDAVRHAHIAAGLLDAVGARLAQSPDLRLAAPAAAARIPPDAGLAKVARGLGVNLVVGGTFQDQAAGFGLALTLHDARANKLLWSGAYSGNAAQVLELQDRVYRDVASALGVTPRPAPQPTADIEAYDLYLRGKNVVERSKGVADLQQAIEHYQAALSRDSRFALALTGLSEAFLAMYRHTKDDLWPKKALYAAQQAQRLADQLPDVHFGLGTVYAFTGRSEAAIAELKRALELAPNSDEGYRRLGRAYSLAGQKDETLAAYQNSVAVNPNYWNNHYQLGQAYVKFGELDKALDAFRRVVELEPDSFYGYSGQASVYFRQGRYAAAIQTGEKCAQIRPQAQSYSNLGASYFYAGRYDAAMKMFEKAVQEEPNNEMYLGNLADAVRHAGHKDKANAIYDRAIARAYKDLNVNPRSTASLSSLALYYARKGEPARALEMIGRARAIDTADVDLMYYEALVHACAGRHAEAIASLRAAFTKGYSPVQALSEPDLQSLRKLPAFEQLTRDFPARR